METQGQQIIDRVPENLQAALKAAMAVPMGGAADAENAALTEIEKTKPKRKVGDGTPGPGRPPGVKTRLINLRDAVLEAFDRVGGAEYLVKLAEGTQSDRTAFVGLMSKVLPTQINANVDGGIKLELSWIGQRSIGTTAAQITEQRTQVLDLERDSEGGYRIIDQHTHTAGGDQAAAGGQTDENGAGDAQGA